MPEDLLQIGEFAKRAETNLRTLRYYEELGLIRPAHRSMGKFRYYSPDQLKRVAAIKRLQGLGLALRDIQDIMVPSRSDVVNALDHIQQGLDRQIELVGERIQSLQDEHDELVAARAKLDDCRTCGHPFDSESCSGCAARNPAVFSVLRSLA